MSFRVSSLWTSYGRLDRGPYAVLGVVLFAFKHNVDRLVASVYFGRPWSPLNYLVPSDQFNVIAIPRSEWKFYAAILGLSLPFIWVGVSLTLQRLRAASLPLSLVVFFFVPVVNLLFFLILSIVPSRLPGETRSYDRPQAWLDRLIPEHPLGSAAMSMVVIIPAGVWVVLLGTNGLKNYGWGLFVGLPFCMGLTSVLIYSYHAQRSLLQCLMVSVLSIILLGLAILAFAIEGLICLAMAAPLAVILSAMGGLVGYAIQRARGSHQAAPTMYCMLIVVLPIFLAVERANQPAPGLIAVRTSINIAASPDQVWGNVVSFSELPQPDEWLFRKGIAYPIRAEIVGQGPGAIRHCVFSTGAFVEPIEIWDEPKLLKFSVTKQPASMRELSLFPHIQPAHLNSYLSSEGGQFLLTPLAGGGTRLEGTTWYRNSFWPAEYWQIWSDGIIHRIHLRVLNHIKHLSEDSAR